MNAISPTSRLNSPPNEQLMDGRTGQNLRCKRSEILGLAVFPETPSRRPASSRCWTLHPTWLSLSADEEVGKPRERWVEAEYSAHISARLYAAARLLSGTLSGRGLVTCRAVVSARIPFTPPSCVVPFP